MLDVLDVLDVLDLVVDFGSPAQVTACAHRYIRHLPEEMQDTFRKEYEAYQRDEHGCKHDSILQIDPSYGGEKHFLTRSEMKGYWRAVLRLCLHC